MRLLWTTAALVALSAPSSAIFATLIQVSPTLAKMAMLGLGTLGPTFFTTSLVYFLGRHFGFGEIRPKFRRPLKPGDRLDFAAQNGEHGAPGYAYYAPEESQYAQQDGQFAYVEGRRQKLAVEEDGAQQPNEEAPARFTHPRGRKFVGRS